MQNARFDTRLFQVFALLGVLTLLVGGVSIAVNRYLIREHQAIVSRNLPVAELASRVGASADLAGSLAMTFAQARSHADLDEATRALDRALAEIEAAIAGLESRMDHPLPRPPEGTPAAGGIVTRMSIDATLALTLRGEVAAEARRLDAQAERLSVMVAGQTDLARLRITSTIAELTGPDTPPLRPALDALADRHFFAFERIGELARDADLIRISIAALARETGRGPLTEEAARLAGLLDDAAVRAAYLPTASAQRELRGLIEGFRKALAPGGLADQAARLADARARLETDSLLLRQRVDRLATFAQDLQAAAQQDNLDRIAAASESSAQLSLALLAAVVLALAAAGGVLFYARRQLIQRMGHVTDRLIGIARGDFGAPVAITGHDEIGRLEKALNILRRRTLEAARLRGHLEDAVIARTREVVAEMQASDAARAEAEDANTRKSLFLARMSHEIRTPLNGVIGMLDLMAGAETRPEAKARLVTALNSARDLVQITNDILTFAAAGDERQELAPVHFDLRELIGGLHAQMQALAGSKGLNVQVDLVPGAPPVLFGDVVKIRQVLMNLISNAVKYTPRGSVTLAVEHAPDADGAPVLAFSVADSGVGMTPEQAAQAFEIYTRAEWVRRAGVEGSGLGLAIARRLTEALGGALAFESAPGVGSRFTLTVPLAVGDPALIAREDEGEGVRSGALVLVVEDHPVNRMVARGFLERLGCRVTEAGTAAAGLAAAQAQHFDLALIDLDLPDRPGQEVIAALGQRSGGPVLAALTAHLIEDTPAGRAALGVAMVLSKPVSPRALAALLSGLEVAPGPQAGGDTLAGLHEDIAAIGAPVVAAMVAAFLQDLDPALDQIIAAKDEARARAAHRLKGAAANFRLGPLCEALKAAEAAPDALIPDDLRATAQAARHVLTQAAEAAKVAQTP